MSKGGNPNRSLVAQTVNGWHSQPTNGMTGGLAGYAQPQQQTNGMAGGLAGRAFPQIQPQPFQGQQPNYGGLTSIMRNALGQPQSAPNYNPQPMAGYNPQARQFTDPAPIGQGMAGIGSFEQRQMQPSPFKPFAGIQNVPPQMLPNVSPMTNVSSSPRLWGHEGWLARGKVPY